MRKLLLIIILVSITIFTACGGEENDVDTDVNDASEEEEQSEVEDEVIENEETEEALSATYKIADNWSITPIADANEKVVLLTIDDAPDKHALEMAKTLFELDANAIFFVNGHFLETSEEQAILKEIFEMGFVIGNHTYSHASLPDLSTEEQKEEIIKVNNMVEDITGVRPTFFRAPFGQNTAYTEQLVEDEGMVLMNWSYGYDWEKEYMSQEKITDIMLNTELLSNGANLLMHDREWTSLGLYDIVAGLRNQGYEMLDPKLIKVLED